MCTERVASAPRHCASTVTREVSLQTYSHPSTPVGTRVLHSTVRWDSCETKRGASAEDPRDDDSIGSTVHTGCLYNKFPLTRRRAVDPLYHTYGRNVCQAMSLLVWLSRVAPCRRACVPRSSILLSCLVRHGFALLHFWLLLGSVWFDVDDDDSPSRRCMCATVSPDGAYRPVRKLWCVGTKTSLEPAVRSHVPSG